MKYARITGVVRWSGGTTILHEGMSADDDHPLVRERPDLFVDLAPGAALSVPRHRVERATRAPGELRDTPRQGRGRPRKLAEAKPEQTPATDG